MSRAVEESNRRLLRARDAMDRRYAEPLDIPTLARIAYVSEAHFIRTFRATFGETPNRYLQRRRVERAMFLLRSTRPAGHRHLHGRRLLVAGHVQPGVPRHRGGAAERRTGVAGRCPTCPSCFAMAWLRPSSFGEAPRHAERS